MKIAVSAQDKNIDAVFETRFGRAAYFIIVDDATKETRALDNAQQLDAVQGAGIQSARHVTDAGAQVVITGHVGPKAFRALHAAGVQIFSLSGKWSVRQVLEKYGNGELPALDNADVEGHWV